MTGVDVRGHRRIAVDDGVDAVVTVGLGVPAWAAAPDGDVRRVAPGTINSVVRVPVRLVDAALVNAVDHRDRGEGAGALGRRGRRDRYGQRRDLQSLCPAGRSGRAVRRAAVDLGCPDRACRARGGPGRAVATGVAGGRSGQFGGHEVD